MSRRRSRGEARPAKVANESAAKARRDARAQAPGVVAPRRSLLLAVTLMPIVFIALALAAYHNSFAGVFLLDDKVRIVGNAQIRDLWPFWNSTAGSSRPIVQVSLAINYALGGLKVRGYHAFNLAIHVLAGLALFGIVRRMFESERLRARYGRIASWLAAVIALIWLVHPLQTESVTYVIQRAESMMGLFFLLTLYAAIRGASSMRSNVWYVGAIIACALGMGSKESMVVAPLVVLLYDRMFMAQSFMHALRERCVLYIGLAATWVLLALVLVQSRAEQQMELIEGVTPLRYALTQPGVIAHYLRLALWPDSLVLDYAWPVAHAPMDIVPWMLLLLVMGIATLIALYRSYWLGFWGAWFFLTLAPTSSILPIADIAFEHRMYLPLAAVVVLAVVAIYGLLEIALARIAAGARHALQAAVAVLAIVALASVTVRRNEDYASESAMWGDIVGKRPDNPRAHYNLGNVFDRQGKPPEAIRQYEEALRIKPDYVDAHVNLGAVHLARGELDSAVAQLSEAVRLKPNSAEARNNLGAALFTQGRRQDAMPHLVEAVRLTPNSAGAHYNLASALVADGRIGEALTHYAAAVRLDPRYVRARDDWGNALLRLGRVDEAIEQYSAALQIDPNDIEARNNLKGARARQAAKPN